jgi:DNA-binding transcriptional LysR family regulator
VGLRFGPLKDSGLRTTKLGQLKFALYAAASYLDRNQRPKTPGDLEALDILRLAMVPKRPLAFDWQGKAVKVTRTPRLLSSDVAGLRDACLQGLGIAQLSTLVAAPWVRAKMLEQVLPDAEFPEASLYAVYASAGQVQPLVKTFIDFARKELGRKQ